MIAEHDDRGRNQHGRPESHPSANHTMPPAIAPGSAMTINSSQVAAEHDEPLAHRVQPAGALIAKRHPGGKHAARPRCGRSS